MVNPFHVSHNFDPLYLDSGALEFARQTASGPFRQAGVNPLQAAMDGGGSLCSRDFGVYCMESMAVGTNVRLKDAEDSKNGKVFLSV